MIFLYLDALLHVVSSMILHIVSTLFQFIVFKKVNVCIVFIFVFLAQNQTDLKCECTVLNTL